MLIDAETDELRAAVNVMVDPALSSLDLPDRPPCGPNGYYIQEGGQYPWRLLYLILDGHDDAAFERALRAIADEQADVVVVSLIGKPLATPLDGLCDPNLVIVWCDGIDDVFLLLEQIVSCDSLIGFDFTDLRHLFYGPLLSGRIARDQLTDWFDRHDQPGVSLAFSAGDTLREIDEAMTFIRFNAKGELIWHTNAAVPRGQCHVLAQSPRPVTHQSDPKAFTITEFARYRRFAEATRSPAGLQYCEPFVPFIGERYGDGTMPRVVYCGVAAGWSERDDSTHDDDTLLSSSRAWSAAFALSGGNRSRFWTLFDDVLRVADAGQCRSALARRWCSVWTNLSKLGQVGETAPPDRDVDLRALDAAQVQNEIDRYSPDLMVCVSGTALIPTGNAAFKGLNRADFKPTTNDSTIVYRLGNGGWLYWTMHPQRQSVEWRGHVLDDVAHIIASIRGAPPERTDKSAPHR